MADVGVLPSRIASKIRVAEGGCWIWTAGKTPQGYGTVYYPWGAKRTWLAHRLVYFLTRGRLSEHLHHKCHVPACVNPSCLREMDGSAHSVLHNAGRPTCSEGHALTEANTYFRRDGKGRQCRICKARRQREVMARKTPAERSLAIEWRSERRRRSKAKARAAA